MGRYGLQCIGSLKEFFTNDMALDIDTKFFRIRTDPTSLENTYDFTIENKKLKIKYKSINDFDYGGSLFVCFLKNNLIQLKDTNEFFIIMKGTFDPGIYSRVCYNTIVWMPPMENIDNISSTQWDNLFSSPGVGVFSSNQDLSSEESFFHFSILANRSSYADDLKLLNRICYYPSTITLSGYDYNSGIWTNGGHTVPDSTSNANYIALCYKIPLVSDTLYTYIDDILLYIKPKDLSSEIRSNMIYDLYRGLHSLYLPGELIENQNCDTKFTDAGNLMVRNEFEEGLPVAALQNSFEAYELIEY